MSKFTVAAATGHNLSANAMEEVSRWSQHTAGIAHLFLALVVNDQVAGQVLRRLAVTLETAGEAVATPQPGVPVGLASIASRLS